MITRRDFQFSIVAGSALRFLAPDPSLADDGSPHEVDLAPFSPLVRRLDVVFLALGIESGERNVVDAASLDRRFTPWSTFKIPKLIIALETGAARDLDHARRWDRKRRPAKAHWPDAWRQDQTLRSAFVRSVPWYFQDVGIERYRSDLSRYDYGNADGTLTGDRFWLDGSLKISVREQVAFLRRVVIGDFGLSSRNQAMLREASLIRSDAGYALHGKTGAGSEKSHRSGAPFEGWFVGWVEKNRRPTAIFALHVRGPSYDAIRTARQNLAKIFLVMSGHLPETWI